MKSLVSYTMQHGGMAQLGARLNGIQKVRGSNPLISTDTTAKSVVFFYAHHTDVGILTIKKTPFANETMSSKKFQPATVRLELFCFTIFLF